MPVVHMCCLCTPGSTSGPGCYQEHSFHVAQLITSCPINLSVGQSCIHFISPSLISNYPYQYPKSHNLGFHQYPLYDTKIKPNQLALYHLHITKLFYFLNQNTMFIIDNKTFTSKLYIVSITKKLSIHHSPYSLFQTIQ